MYALIFLFAAILLGAFGQIAMKYGMNKVGEITASSFFSLSGFFKVFGNAYVVLGVGLYIVSLLTWLIALSRLDVSFMYPLIAVGYVIVAMFAFIFLKENITLFRWIGIIFIVVGSYFILKS